MSLPPLSVHPTNPLWFWDGTQTVYLSGSYSWDNMLDVSKFGDYDRDALLATLAGLGHNFVRLFMSDHGKTKAFEAAGSTWGPLPYARSGTAGAGDGGNKYDLTQYSTTYFSRLRAFILEADSLGIYCGLMLFNPLAAWGVAADSVSFHPYASGNNINGITGEVGGNMQSVYSTTPPTGVQALQEAYVTRMLQEVDDLPNVIIEIANECGATEATHTWQQYWIDFVRTWEAANAEYQHLVWRSPEGGSGGDDSTAVLATDADIISPDIDWTGFTTSATAANTFTRPSILDTDHTWGFFGGLPTDAWRAVTRGHHFQYVDDIHELLAGGPNDTAGFNPNTALRAACGHIASYANRMNSLGACTPQASKASTGFCLTDGVNDFLVYQPDSAGFTVDLSDVTTNHLRVEWINTNNGQVKRGPNISSTSATQAFTPPFAGSPSGVALFLSVPVRDVPSEGWRGVA